MLTVLFVVSIAALALAVLVSYRCERAHARDHAELSAALAKFERINADATQAVEELGKTLAYPRPDRVAITMDKIVASGGTPTVSTASVTALTAHQIEALNNRLGYNR